MENRDFEQDEHFILYITEKSHKALYINGLDDSKFINQEKTEKYIKIAQMLKNWVK